MFCFSRQNWERFWIHFLPCLLTKKKILFPAMLFKCREKALDYSFKPNWSFMMKWNFLFCIHDYSLPKQHVYILSKYSIVWKNFREDSQKPKYSIGSSSTVMFARVLIFSCPSLPFHGTDACCQEGSGRRIPDTTADEHPSAAAVGWGVPSVSPCQEMKDWIDSFSSCSLAPEGFPPCGNLPDSFLAFFCCCCCFRNAATWMGHLNNDI